MRDAVFAALAERSAIAATSALAAAALACGPNTLTHT
jgi:hypothetical protein